MNGQITMNGLDQVCETIRADIAKLSAAVATANTHISALKTDLDQAKASLARIEQAVVGSHRPLSAASIR